MPTFVEITIKNGQKRKVTIPDTGTFDMVMFLVPVKDAIPTLERFGFKPEIVK